MRFSPRKVSHHCRVGDDERPKRVGPNAEAVANVREFILSPREFTTRVGGLFLFVHDLVRLGADAAARGRVEQFRKGGAVSAYQRRLLALGPPGPPRAWQVAIPLGEAHNAGAAPSLRDLS